MKLFERNGLFIDELTQKEIRKASIMLAGCGLSSQIAILAARTGFFKFLLIDGDNVEESNLNRQAFNREDVGVNKAKALADKIKAINNKSEVRVFPRYLKSDDRDNIEDLVDSVDIVVNTVDFNKVAFFINEATRKMGKIEVFPLNLGFGAFFLYFNRDEKRKLSELAETQYGVSGYYNVVKNTLGISKVAPYMLEAFEEFNPEVEDGFPQIGVAANLNASLIAESLIRNLRGEGVDFVNYFDPRN